MANIDSPFGLKPVRHLNGNPWNGQTKKFLIEDDDTHGAYFIGDPVIVEGVAGADDTTGIYPTIVIATDTTSHPLYGVIVSFDLVGPTGLAEDTVYNPAKTSRYANVCVDPDVIFIVQDNGDSALTGDVIGNNALLESATAGITATGLSGWELDGSSVGTTATDTVLILNAYPIHNNTIGLINCIWEVIISNHMLRCQDATTGV